MTIRLRVALLLATCFLVAGALVLGIGAVTYQRAVYDSPQEQTDQLLDRLGVTREQAVAYLRAHPDAVLTFGQGSGSDGSDAGVAVNEAFVEVQADAQDTLLDRSRRWTIAAFVVVALLAGAAGWVIAGRALAPVRLITARARAASSTDLSGRVGVEGPHDEIRELAGTFDEMLDRLERAFRAQRAFSAQVSHELRTPLSIIASEAELLLRAAEPAQEPSLARIRGATGRAERITTALLDLARSGSGDVATSPVDLDTLVGDVLGQLVNGPDWRRLRVELDLEPAPVLGDAALLEHLVANLLANAAQHNRADGVVEVGTGLDGDRAVLTVTNSRPRPEADGDGRPGTGVGLTVVESVLTAHGGRSDWSWETGTVTVAVSLPAAAAPGQGDGGAGATSVKTAMR